MSALETVTEPPLRQTSDDLPNFKGERGQSTPAADFERQWLEDYLAGDSSGFISFYHRYRGQLYRYLLAHMSAEAANRLFVQSWLDFITHCRDVPHDITPGAAVFAEAHRLVLEGYRTLDKSLLLSFADGVVETAGEVPQTGFTDNAELQATRLVSLPPAWREALQIYLETGFDGDSLAHALHISRDTARSRLKRAFSMWRKQWPDGDTGVEDTLLRSTQHWIFRYRSLVSIEPPDYLDARILRQADWHNHWLPRLGNSVGRYWHFGLTALLTGIGVFGFLWTNSADPTFTLEVPQAAPQITQDLASPVMAVPVQTVAVAASAPAASALAASAPSASSVAASASAVKAPAPAPAVPAAIPAAAPAAAPAPATAGNERSRPDSSTEPATGSAAPTDSKPARQRPAETAPTSSASGSGSAAASSTPAAAEAERPAEAPAPASSATPASSPAANPEPLLPAP